LPRKPAPPPSSRRSPSRAAISDAWTCPRCGRSFTQSNQRHACGTGDRAEVLRGRPDSLVQLYGAIEAFATSLGPIEIVTRERYVLLRSTRIFADLVIMADAIRIAIHLRRTLDDPMFFKVVSDGKKITHVAKLRSERDLRAVRAYVKEAYESSLEPAKRRT
jgi:hypothetical protein